MTTLIESVSIQVEILEGRNLVAKDRKLGLIGKKTTSDPYVRVRWNGQFYGHTEVQKKTLNPTWNYKVTINIPTEQTPQFLHNKCPPLELWISDWDANSADDPMGIVTIPLTTSRDNIQRQWFPVTTGTPGNTLQYCHNATGELCVSITIHAHKLMSLEPGQSHLLNYPLVSVGLSWEPEHNKKIDLDASCVALSNDGNILMDHTIYYGNTSNANRSICHSGDEQTGHAKGDDEQIHLALGQIPSTVACLYILLSVSTPNTTLNQIHSASIRFYHYYSSSGNNNTHQKKHGICGLTPREVMGDSQNQNTTLIVARMTRNTMSTNKWTLSPILQDFRPARDFGTLIPQLKSLSRDIMPDIYINPNERIAILQKNGVIDIRDYCNGQTLPEMISFGLAWDITHGHNIDLDASAICLDADLNLVDLIYFKSLTSKDGGSIQHCGDEREGDEEGDDETINIRLSRVDPNIQYIGIVVNSYSGQELDDVARASCHLYDSATYAEIARYALTDAKPLDKHTALVMGCLYRNNANEKDGWMFQIISEPAQGRLAQDNVDELQNFLRRNPVPTEPTIVVEQDEEEIDLSMPPFVENTQEEEIVVVPMAELEEDEIMIPPMK